MKIRKLNNADKESLEHFLSGYAETSMFLRSNMRTAGLEYKDKEYYGDYFGSFTKDEEINGVLAHYWNGNIMMQTAGELISKKLVSTFRDAVTRPVAGVVGATNQSDIVISELGLSNAVFSLNCDEGLYALDLGKLVLPSHLNSKKYEVIDACKVDKMMLFKWIKAYDIEALKYDDNEALNERVQNRIDGIDKNSDFWALMVDDVLVSLSGFNARLPDIVQIGPVWTPPKYRSNGYARSLVALTLQGAKEKGIQRSVLFTDSPAAIKAYESIGFERTNSYRLALLKTPISF